MTRETVAEFMFHYTRFMRLMGFVAVLAFLVLAAWLPAVPGTEVISVIR